MKEKSITIHGINKELDRKIQEKSRELHLSQNKTVKKILEDSLLKDVKSKRLLEFEDLYGTWSEEEYKEFEKNTEDDEKIFEEDWK
ncbi:MAG: hypothetical protein ACHQJ4_01255 [Ignavibacteria bacterium]